MLYKTTTQVMLTCSPNSEKYLVKIIFKWETCGFLLEGLICAVV